MNSQKPMERGELRPAEELLPLVYEELRKLAAHKMAQEAPGQTLQPTALVHEAWLRLGGKPGAKFANPAHFFAAAAEAMRRILIEAARRKHSQQRGGTCAGKNSKNPLWFWRGQPTKSWRWMKR